jgi:hypothetical protein
VYRDLNALYRFTYRLDEAKTIALERRRVFAKDPIQLYYVAMELAMAIPLAEKHPTWTREQKLQAQQEYKDLTLQVLQEAADRGFKNTQWLKRDAAIFASLQARNEFQTFRQTVEKNEQTKP